MSEQTPAEQRLLEYADSGEPCPVSIVVSDFEYFGLARVTRTPSGFDFQPLSKLGKRLSGCRLNPARLPA